MKSLKKNDKAALKTSEQPVILERSIFWSSAFVWLIIGLTVSAVTWACLAQIEEAVPAAGKLEPEGATKEIQAPTGGVIRTVEVKDGDHVKAGQLLITLDPTSPQADLESLSRTKAALTQENRFYTAQVNGFRLRGTAEENATPDFTRNQEQLLVASRVEFNTRVEAARLEVIQLQTQLAQAQKQLATARDVLAANQGILAQSIQIRDTNKQILDDMKPVAESGALSQLQYKQQQQRFQSAESDVLNRQAAIATAQGDIARYTKEEQRLSALISQAQERLNNTASLTYKEVLSKIADNQKKISEIEAQMSKAKLALSYQEIRSPIEGTVFDMKAKGPGFVISGNTTTQPLMTIVPKGRLVAKVYITNRDIGFVREGMPVEVKVDTFPNLEFGSIKGKLVNIGSDALPPTQERPFYAFPAKVEIESQEFDIGGGRKIPLQAGMSVNSSILIRKRSVMTIFLSQFTNKVDSFKYVR
ncbi:HlyD family type I secretion periplasmic adaptor subunit [Pseudanabaena sp. PCC 6802]|uniref:HlyD family type I secretion periplasmic adaptor subunit n=1 Tax=Pseudanabaena sp. PCC 6802 TaxID=118173 RepID=UPI000346FFD5|nr:HlyD family type I secretion periplasmic adaptor subunit [Pseudanabaena sp. PCC 6802]